MRKGIEGNPSPSPIMKNCMSTDSPTRIHKGAPSGENPTTAWDANTPRGPHGILSSVYSPSLIRLSLSLLLWAQ